ncbi:MAG TPA: PAS domain S-box protein, partial [Dissulfurispiraceae bacterium]|nr:PAS domain S-box protein [Dissulfurispiraceae bacterium]
MNTFSIFDKLGRMKNWQYFVFIVVAAELCALIINVFQGIIRWGGISIELMEIGVIDVLIVAPIVTALLLPLLRNATRIEFERKKYQEEIDERRRAEQALKESEEKFSKAFHDAPIMMAISSIENGTYIEVNDKVLEVSGFSREEIIGKSSVGLGFLKQEDRDRIIKELKHKGRIAGTDLTLFAKDGSPVHCNYRGEIITIQGQQRLLSILINVSEQKQAREALMASEAKYRALFEESRDVVFISSLNGKILDVNRAGVELFGFESREDMIANADLGSNMYVNMEDRIALRAELENKSFVKDHPIIMKKTSGEQLEVLITASTIKDVNGDITGYRGIVRDVTSQKTLERQLQQAQKMEAIGQLAGGIAHDFNNILSAITGYSYLLRTKLDDNDKRTADIEQILDAANRAAELIQGLLAFSRKQLMNPKPVNINDIVKRAEKLLARLIGEDIEVITEFAVDELFITGDAGRIEQVLMNLATNARDAMPLGGSLSIRSAAVQLDNSFIRYHGFGKPGNYALLCIADTGTGIKQQDIAKIFEPFFTTKEIGKGTGLGLAMVYGIIKQHDGYITVHSDVGKGTIFNVYLPAIEAPPAIGPAAASEQQIAGGNETILVVEDDEALRLLFEAVLVPCGYKVLAARNGEEAVRKFAENKDDIQLVVMDMIMPKKSGMEACEEIQKICPDVKILFSSGYTADKITQDGL